MAEIRRRKKKLEDDLELLEGNFENRISTVQKKVLGTLKPLKMIKKNPLKAVGSSVLIGFAIGMMGDNRASSNEDSSGHLQKEKLVNLFFNEVKRIAARKAGMYLSDFVDQKISKRK